MDVAFADRWFAALDQRHIGSGDRGWTAQVVAVHHEPEGLWLQVAPVDDLSATILVHVSVSTSLDEVLETLAKQAPH
jgi:hypothetical protein